MSTARNEDENIAEATLRVWRCPECAFGMDADHTDADGSHSCPCCAQIRLESELESARALVAEYERLVDASLEAHKDANTARAYSVLFNGRAALAKTRATE